MTYLYYLWNKTFFHPGMQGAVMYLVLLWGQKRTLSCCPVLSNFSPEFCLAMCHCWADAFSWLFDYSPDDMGAGPVDLHLLTKTTTVTSSSSSSSSFLNNHWFIKDTLFSHWKCFPSRNCLLVECPGSTCSSTLSWWHSQPGKTVKHSMWAFWAFLT